MSRGYGISVTFKVRSELHLLGVCHMRAFTLITCEVTCLTGYFTYVGENWEEGRKHIWSTVLTSWKEFILDC